MKYKTKLFRHIYVCSPYTALLNFGGSAPTRTAHIAVKRAAKFYATDGVKLFSPVLEFSAKHKDKSYEEVMEICLAKLKECDEVFITGACMGDDSYVKNSKGIYEEFCTAIAENIAVSSDTPEILEYFWNKIQKDSQI